MSYGDYMEQLTYLLFLKMAEEKSSLIKLRLPIPDGYDWKSLVSMNDDALGIHYRHILEALSTKEGMLGVIFGKAQNKIQDPCKAEEAH